MNKILTFSIMSALALSLGACDQITAFKAEPFLQSTKEKTDENFVKAQGLAGNQVPNDPLTVSNQVWAGSTAMRLRRGQPLPGSLETDRGITLVATTPMTLAAIGSQLAATTGIPVRLSDDLNDNANAGSIPLGSGATGPTIGPAELNSPMTIAYEGPLSALLDQVGSHFNLSWRYDGSAITFFRYETRTFVIESLPGTQSVTDGLQSSQSQGGSGGGTGGTGTNNSQDVKQDSELKADLAFWDELRSSVESILGGNGRFTTSPSSGTVTITTTPDRMRTVAEYIQQENMRLGRQVAINVEVYLVTLQNSDDYGLDLGAVLTGQGGPLSATGTLPGVTGTVTGNTILGTGVTSPVINESASALSFAILGKNFSLTGVVNALSSVGKVAIVTRMPITTLNNRPASRKITVDQAYLASVSTEAVSGAGVSTSLTPGVVSTGITLQLLPRFLLDGRIMLQYSLKMSELQELTSFESGENAIQLPEVANKIFVQQALLESGSTLVLAGFDQDDQRGNKRGVGDPSFWGLGGGMLNSRNRQYMVIAITPREVTPGKISGVN